MSSVGTALRRLWAEVLGAPEVGPFDDFFSLGGDSLLVLQMLARAREIGVDLELDRLGEFLEESTCTQLLELTGNGGTPDPGSEDGDVTTITVRTGDDAANVFVLLPSMQDVSMVRELSAQVPGAPVRVLVPAWSPERSYRSLPSIGAAITARMAAIQPRGPYRIVGLCSAGQAAVEAASRLAAAGHAVDLLALVDSRPPRPGRASQPMHRLLPVRAGTRGVPPSLFAKLMWLDLLRASASPPPEDLMRYLWIAIRAHIDDLMRFLVEVQPERWTDAYRDRAARVFMTWLNYQLASDASVAPPPYAGRMSLLYAREPAEGCGDPTEEAESWARLTGCAYDVELIDDEHRSAIIASSVVARLVRRSLSPL